jgi:hypothetical protein
MAFFPRPARPHVLIADIKRVWRSSTGRYKLVFGTVSVAITSLVVTGFLFEKPGGLPPKGPEIIYAADYPATRTDQQIREDQWADARERRAEAEERRRQWKKLNDVMKRFGF